MTRFSSAGKKGGKKSVEQGNEPDTSAEKNDGLDNDPIGEMSKDLFDFLRKQSKSIRVGPMPFGDSIGDAKTNDKKKKFQLKFNHKPKDIKAHLDRFVIQQEEAKRVLSVAVCDHYNHIKQCRRRKSCKHYFKQNVIMVGPTGVGKTFLIRCLADLIGVPFVKSDATKFTETGYVGGDVEDLVRQLVQQADGDVELAEYGIVYVDEVDKITGAKNLLGKDISGRGVQSNLLKLLEETEVPVKAPWDIQSQLMGMMNSNSPSKDTVNTKHILFIVSGVFDGLDEVVKKRTEGSKFGFERHSADLQADELMEKASTGDFVKMGLEPEFIGRLPVRTFLEGLQPDDLFKILKVSESSIVNQYIEAFKSYGISVSFTDDALKILAESAHKEKTGARGLVTVFERAFRHYKFELPSRDIKTLTITKDIAENPEKALQILLK